MSTVVEFVARIPSTVLAVDGLKRVFVAVFQYIAGTAPGIRDVATSGIICARHTFTALTALCGCTRTTGATASIRAAGFPTAVGSAGLTALEWCICWAGTTAIAGDDHHGLGSTSWGLRHVGH